MIVGTRGSRLAMAQTDMFIRALRSGYPDLRVETRIVATTGDRVRDRPLSALGVGAFVKELDHQILEGRIDVAVNSLKDMPVDLTPGIAMAAVLPRGPVEDVIIPDVAIEDLPGGAIVGTSSVRRRALVLSRRRDLVLRELRGNVPTRLRKLREGEYDAIIVARAGLERLGFEGEYRILDPQRFVPAVGQGTIAAVCSAGSPTEEMLRPLDYPPTRAEVEAERRILRLLGGGCSVPIGLWARMRGGSVRIVGVVLSEDGATISGVDEEISLDDLDAGIERIGVRMKRDMEALR